MNRRGLAYIFGLVLTAALLVYVLSRDELLEAIVDVSFLSAAMVLGIAIVALVSLGLQFRAIASVFGVALRPREWLGLTAVNTMVSYAMPARGGVVVRAIYMSRVHGMGIARYSALTAIALSTTLAVAAVAGSLLALTALDGSSLRRAMVLFGSTLGVLALAGTALFTATVVGKRLRVVEKVLTPLRDGLLEAGRRRLAMSRFLMLTIVFFAAQGLRLWAAFEAIGADVSLARVLVIHSAATLAFVISLTPGSLGIKEGVIAGVASLIGVDTDLALLAALLDRAAAVVVTFATGLTLGPLLARRAVKTRP